jgi:hypothetical protein
MAWGNDRRILCYSMRVELDLRVFKKEDKTRELFVANFNSSGGDLLHAVSSFIEALPAEELVARDRRHFGQPRDVERQGRTICWRMDGGESGRATSVMLKQGDRWRKREMTTPISTLSKLNSPRAARSAATATTSSSDNRRRSNASNGM